MNKTIQNLIAQRNILETAEQNFQWIKEKGFDPVITEGEEKLLREMIEKLEYQERMLLMQD